MDTFQLFLKNFNEVFNQGENIFQEELNKNISFVINDLKKIDAGSDRKDLQVFLKNLVIIAQADGVIAEPEKRWIQNFCNALDVDYPKEILDNSDKQRPKIIELLADQGGGLKEAKEIIDNDKSQVNATDILMHTHGFTPLHYACWDGKDDLVEYLIEQGVDIHIYEERALRESVDNGHTEIMKYLIEKGANISVLNLQTRLRLGIHTWETKPENITFRTDDVCPISMEKIKDSEPKLGCSNCLHTFKKEF